MYVVVEQTTSSTAAVEEKRTRDSVTPTAAARHRVKRPPKKDGHSVKAGCKFHVTRF
jgi:hypothetical protein